VKIFGGFYNSIGDGFVHFECDNLGRNASAPQLLEPDISKNREEPALQVAANSQTGHPWYGAKVGFLH
jgi:hypothetical protein